MQEKTERPYHHGDLKRVIIETAQDMLREEKGWQFRMVDPRPSAPPSPQ